MSIVAELPIDELHAMLSRCVARMMDALREGNIAEAAQWGERADSLDDEIRSRMP